MTAQVLEDNQTVDMTKWLKMVERLRCSPDWAEDERPVEVIQTHISMVLFGGRRALKLKKPVDFGFLDYTTPEKRLWACEAEVALNRRLCADTYLGVQPIAEADGELHLTNEGRVIDYAVLMKRLPAEKMLDQMVLDNTVTETVIDRIAEKLARFHKLARRGADVNDYGSSDTIRRNWEENFVQTAPFVNRTITQKAFGVIRAFVTSWLEQNTQLLKLRVAEERICDGHGDLRSESICVTNGICFFDCIEFNERFRCGDVASEVAFLAMDLDARGCPDLSYYFCERYATISADFQIYKLLPFYRCYRAFVRGKVLSFRLDEPGFSSAELENARARAENFFDLAARYAEPLLQPTVIVVAGLSGTGKTSVARAVAAEFGLRVVSADAVRKTIFGDTQNFGYGEGAYSAENNQLTYQKMIEQGRALFLEDGGVVLDATFRRVKDREQAHSLAESVGARWRIIECRLAPDLIRQRLEQRGTRKEGFSDATWETYLEQLGEFEMIESALGESHLVLDTGNCLRDVNRNAEHWLRKSDEP